MSDDTPAYIGRKDCGCVVFVLVDTPEHKKDTAKEIARAIRDGLTIEHTTVSLARPQIVFDCPHDGKAAARKANQPVLL